MSINNVIISGNLTRDAEIKETKNGSKVLSFSVAVNERRKTSKGEWEDYANFVDCVVFGKRGEALAKHFKKGAKVTVSGHLRWSQWERDGQKRSKLDVIAEELDFVAVKQQNPQIDANTSIEDDMIPF